MTTTSPSVPLGEIRLALDKVLHSEALRKSPSLSQLLQYLVVQAFEHRCEFIKESVIAFEVFQRRDFDGRADNIVRVQAHRLRKTLDGYYAGEGAGDELRFSIPKGSYVPQIASVTAVPAPLFRAGPECGPNQPRLNDPGDASSLFLSVPALPAPGSVLRRLAIPAAFFLAGISIGGGVVWNREGKAHRALPGVESAAVEAAIEALWGPVFRAGVPVKIAYANPVFLRVGKTTLFSRYHGAVSAPEGSEIALPAGDPHLDRTLIPGDQPLRFSSGWTGIGEVMAVSRLTVLGMHFGVEVIPVPERNLQFSDLRGTNVIFAGTGSGEGELSHFGMHDAPIRIGTSGNLEIPNPLPGEPAEMRNEVTPQTDTAVAGYTLLSVGPGTEPHLRIVSSNGAGTWESWAAIEYATSGGAATLAKKLRKANGGVLPAYFQAVIRTEMIKGVVSNATLVLVRPISK